MKKANKPAPKHIESVQPSKKSKTNKVSTKTPKATQTGSKSVTGTIVNRGGRPTLFSESLADSICAMLAEGKSLRTITKNNPDTPSIATIFNWFKQYPQFLEQYTRAKSEAADAMVDELLDLADNVDDYSPAAVHKARLQIDTRKWVASKLKPKVYGDKLDVTSDGEKVVPIIAVVPPTPPRAEIENERLSS